MQVAHTAQSEHFLNEPGNRNRHVVYPEAINVGSFNIVHHFPTRAATLSREEGKVGAVAGGQALDRAVPFCCKGGGNSSGKALSLWMSTIYKV